MPNDAVPKKNKRRLGLVFLSMCVGMLVLVVAHVSLKATDSAPFCGSCHVMSDAVVTHRMSLHAKLDCNDCHLPVNFTERMINKTIFGFHDFTAFHFSAVESPIFSSQKTKDIVQANCVRCHTESTRNVNMNSKPYCVDCHRQVPHMRTLPISKRKVGDV
ncbi:cytochrome c3 family protein [Desulfovibrio litoralis]|uniref:Cytochrome c-type protein n=1 Tax=Desulfovibrio litoralis DSM 11393 TaxID=1121455 RepID=A0A1M7SEP1_9BACT|nr:NapC/NirT family cytochrome c [Desulfovibrio litoralis]SHN56956.1 cytochrome c nitrite reductase small subunit [Desulfovibrio litoralis DSM 11393]